MRKRLVFSGRVQGVGFRATCRALARDLPLAGWVRNEPDGRVTLEAQGEPDQVDTLAARIQQRMGRYITDFQQDEIAEQPDEQRFRIEY